MNRVLNPRALSVWVLMHMVFLINPGINRASWQVVFSLPDGNGFTACFFFNESVGFIAGELSDGVFKTTDGGQTWINTQLPDYPNGTQPSGTVTQIVMTDPLNGWLTCEPETYVPTSVYQTTNGGLSWEPTGLTKCASDIYQTPSAIIVTSRSFNGATGFISTDGGNSYKPALDNTNGIDFVDDLHGVATGYLEQNWYHTVDGGVTWNNLAPADTETWSIYGVKNTPWFFTAGEGDWSSGWSDNHLVPSSVQYSSDFGATWNVGTKLPFRTTGHIVGFGFTLYVQDENDPLVIKGDTVPHSGLWRSKDSGKTWVSIEGPDNTEDTRFFVTGCRGEVIYAFDQGGKVYKSSDGGDGSLPQFSLPPSLLDVDSMDVCNPRDTIITITDLGCDTVRITNASAPASPALAILDSATGKPPIFPIVIADSGGTASLELVLSSFTAGAYQSKVVLEIEREGFVTYDTVTVNSALKFYNPLRLLAEINYDSTELCGSTDSALTILNDSCFSVQIVNSSMKYGSSFVLDTTYTNDSIPADSIKSFPIRFAPAQQGKIVDSLVLNLLVLGRPVRISYPVSGVGKSDNPKLALEDQYGNPLPAEINFDTITRCRDSLFAFTIFEQGCDSLFVTVEWLDSTMNGPPPRTQFSWGNAFQNGGWVISGDTAVDGIEALPAIAGSYEGFLRISDSIKGGASTLITLIPYKVFVEPGTRTLSLEDSIYAYDTIPFCDQMDSLIPIVNLGCDTIHDSVLSIAGPDFVLVKPPNTPFIINPHDTFYVTVRYLPINSGSGSDTLTIVTDADSAPVRQIVLSGYATPTDTVQFSAVTPNTTVIPGDTETVIVMTNAAFKNNGLSNVAITLSYNGDIMTPYPIGAPVASTQMAGALAPVVMPEINTGPELRNLPITIDGTNMTFDSATPILTIQFVISLSDSLSTDFHIASLALNNGDNVFSKCLLGASIDTGSIALQFVCGDTELYNFLRYGTNWSPNDGIVPISGAVHPNPVLEGSPISVPFTALRAVAVKIEIMNEIGSVVYSDLCNIPQAEATTYIIPGSVIKSGAYHYRLHPIDGGTGVAKGSFIVIR
jgi:photosystem II stability/assembly factor-like uncharacterized protein